MTARPGDIVRAVAVTLAFVPARVSAQITDTQSMAVLTTAAAAISAQNIERHIRVIADDSMHGRETPSRGLDLTAGYVAGQFRESGLISLGGTTEDWGIQRYPLPRLLQLNFAGTRLRFGGYVQVRNKSVMTETGEWVQKDTTVSFGPLVRFASDTLPQSGADKGDLFHHAHSVVVAGPHTVASVMQGNVQDLVVFYVPHPGTDSASRRQIVDLLRVSNDVVVLDSGDSVGATSLHDGLPRRPFVVNRAAEKLLNVQGWAIDVSSPGVSEFLGTVGLDLARIRATPIPTIRPLSTAWVTLNPGVESASGPAPMAMNVVGILYGRDRRLLQQSVVVTAHMDHANVALGSAASDRNGADDNASGVAGLIELAKALARPGVPRPRRSIIFLAVSGSADFSGSSHWLRSQYALSYQPVLDLNLDMVGRHAGDSIRVDGLSDLELTPRPEWVAAQHPELGLTLIDGGSIANAKSDHVAFMRRYLPALYFYNGSHEVGPQGPGPAIDADQEARILRLVFYVTHALADADPAQAPRWSSGARERIRAFLGP